MFIQDRPRRCVLPAPLIVTGRRCSSFVSFLSFEVRALPPQICQRAERWLVAGTRGPYQHVGQLAAARCLPLVTLDARDDVPRQVRRVRALAPRLLQARRRREPHRLASGALVGVNSPPAAPPRSRPPPPWRRRGASGAVRRGGRTLSTFPCTQEVLRLGRGSAAARGPAASRRVPTSGRTPTLNDAPMTRARPRAHVPADCGMTSKPPRGARGFRAAAGEGRDTATGTRATERLRRRQGPPLIPSSPSPIVLFRPRVDSTPSVLVHYWPFSFAISLIPTQIPISGLVLRFPSSSSSAGALFSWRCACSRSCCSPAFFTTRRRENGAVFYTPRSRRSIFFFRKKISLGKWEIVLSVIGIPPGSS